MGNYAPPSKCFITDIEKLENKPSDEDLIEYYLFYDGKRYDFSFPGSFYGGKNKILNEYKWILKGLVMNHKWPVNPNENVLLDEKELERIAKEADIPRTPKEKMSNLLLSLFKISPVEGEEFNINEPVEQFISKLYFKTEEQFSFYLETLYENKLISGTVASGKGIPSFWLMGIKLTYEGLNQVIKLQEDGKNSNRCFVAMSFSDEAKPIRKAIREVCEGLGLQAVLIDETHFESDQTINDAMIAEIKKSKFCIADFTEQKHNVYFETGYTLGRGLKVIYTCHKDSWKDTHFDTNHFPHIKYQSLEELKEQLKDKIEAWIL